MPSEFELIAKYFTRPARTAALGVGDDCALIRPPAGRLGHKSLAVNLSDLAAMGADPRWFLLAIALPDVDEAWLEAFAAGMFALAEAHAIELIGGDTTRGPRTITITAIGTLPPGYALRRDAAQSGDDVWLSGATGDAALGLAHLKGKIVLTGEAAARCIARLEQPAPRVALGQRLRGVAAAAIDVSDGLLADLGHILERSKLAAEIDYESLPRSPDLRACSDAMLADACLLAGGDDYELVFTAAPDRRATVEAAGRAADVVVTRIGRTIAGAPEVRLLDRAGKPLRVEHLGFDHFR